MIPLWAASASGLTSLTTSGTSSLMRQREELSITTAPPSTNRGAHSPEMAPPAENSARSKSRIDSSLRARTTRAFPDPLGSSRRRPAERSEANGTISRAGNDRSRSSASISVPTCPVAPTTATR